MPSIPLTELTDLVELVRQYDAARDELRKDIGKLLRRLRLERGLSLRTAATMLNCDFSSLHKNEQGVMYSPTIIEQVLHTYPRLPIVKQLTDDTPNSELASV